LLEVTTRPELVAFVVTAAPAFAGVVEAVVGVPADIVTSALAASVAILKMLPFLVAAIETNSEKLCNSFETLLWRCATGMANERRC